MAKRFPRKCPEPKQGEAYRADGWQNVMTGLNVAGYDKRRSSNFLPKRMSEFEAEDIWRGDAIIERAIETIPLVMLRNGFDVAITDPTDAKEPQADEQRPANDGKGKVLPFATPASNRMDAKAIAKLAKQAKKQKPVATMDPMQVKKEMAKKLAKLQVVPVMLRAMNSARAFGGSAVWLGIEDQGKGWKDQTRHEKPLNELLVKDIRHLIVLRPHECWPIRWYTDDQQDPKYGSPSHFYVMRDTMGGAAASPIIVHETRLLRFFGTVTSVRQQSMNNSWGESILMRFIETVADFQQSYQGTALLLTDFAQAVHAIQGLAELIAAGDDAAVLKRAELIAQGRSIARTVLIDSEETYERKATPITGLPETLDRLATKVAGDIHMPVTLLFGEAPAGLNATGDSDVRWFYDETANNRELHLRPMLEQLIRLIFLSSEGPTAGVEPAGWKVNFHPLWQPTDKEVAERNFTQAQADALYVTNEILTPEEVGESRFGGDNWNPDTHLDEELRSKIKEAHEAMVDDQVEQGQIPIASATAAAGQQQAAGQAMAENDRKSGDDQVNNTYKSQLSNESAAREAEARARIKAMGKK